MGASPSSAKTITMKGSAATILAAALHIHAFFCHAFPTNVRPWSTCHIRCGHTALVDPPLLPTDQPPTADIVLSAGNCAFAYHCGFLEGVEKTLSRDRVGAVVGTSSGALVGALWAAGYSPHEIGRVVQEDGREDGKTANGSWLGVVKKRHWQLWNGLYSLSGLLELLREYLPPTFEELAVPFAVGVQDSRGRTSLLHSGPLPEAVAASLAVKYLFKPVKIGQTWFRSSATRDRTNLSLWASWRRGQRVLVHCVDDDRDVRRDRSGLGNWIQDPRIVAIRSPRSRSSWRGLVEYQQEQISALKHVLRVVSPETIHDFPTLYPDDVYAEYLFASLDP